MPAMNHRGPYRVRAVHDVAEGLLEDLAHGHIPNLWQEAGGPAEWRHNREGLIRKLAITTAVARMLCLMRRKR